MSQLQLARKQHPQASSQRDYMMHDFVELLKQAEKLLALSREQLKRPDDRAALGAVLSVLTLAAVSGPCALPPRIVSAMYRDESDHTLSLDEQGSPDEPGD
jgi:hypothetical protein